MGWLLAWTMMTASALTLQFLPSDAYFSTEAADIEWATPTVMLRYERIESWFMACGTAGFTTLTVTHVDPRDVAAIRDAVRRADRWFVPTEAQPERPMIGIADPVFVLLVDRRADLDQYRPGRRYNEQIQEDVTATAAHAVDHTFEIDTHAAAVPHLQFTAAPRMERTDHEGGTRIARASGTVSAASIRWVIATRSALDGTAKPQDRVFWTVRRGKLRRHRWAP